MTEGRSWKDAGEEQEWRGVQERCGERVAPQRGGAGCCTELPCIYAKISSGLIRPLAYVPCDRDTLKWYDYMGRKSSVWMISNRKG